MPRVVVCGNIVFDILARPVEEVRWEATTVVENVEQQLGGNAGSTSYTLAKLGSQVTIATLVGRDSTAEIVLGHLQERLTAGFSHDLPVPFYRLLHGKRMRELL